MSEFVRVRHSRAGGNTAWEIAREANNVAVSLRENYSVYWIPACAGMTRVGIL